MIIQIKFLHAPISLFENGYSQYKADESWTMMKTSILKQLIISFNMAIYKLTRCIFKVETLND